MMELIQDLPDHVLGVRASGKVTGEDYETILMPAVEDKLTRREKLSCIYHLAEGFQGFEAAALWDDAKVQYNAPSLIFIFARRRNWRVGD